MTPSEPPGKADIGWGEVAPGSTSAARTAGSGSFRSYARPMAAWWTAFGIHDPGLALLRSAARAAIVIPAVFARC